MNNPTVAETDMAITRIPYRRIQFYEPTGDRAVVTLECGHCLDTRYNADYPFLTGAELPCKWCAINGSYSQERVEAFVEHDLPNYLLDELEYWFIRKSGNDVPEAASQLLRNALERACREMVRNGWPLSHLVIDDDQPDHADRRFVESLMASLEISPEVAS